MKSIIITIIYFIIILFTLQNFKTNRLRSDFPREILKF